jgi:hypothetical protein
LTLVNIGGGKNFGWKISQILRGHTLGFELQVEESETTVVLEIL